MGYYIRPKPEKKSEPKWKIQFVSHKKEHNQSSTAKNPKKTWNIPRERWRGLGFRGSMTLEQARARQRQLNSQNELKRQEERRQKIEEAQNHFSEKCAAHLPEIRPFKERGTATRIGATFTTTSTNDLPLGLMSTLHQKRWHSCRP